MSSNVAKYSLLDKNLNKIYILLIFISIAITCLFFRAWNRPSLDIPKIDSKALRNSFIDSCVYSEKDITVKGWAFTEGNPHTLNRIFAMRKNGEWTELMSSSVTRTDVSAAFKNPLTYDHSGFIATRRDGSVKDGFNHEIMIVSFDGKGIGYAAKYHCQ